MNTTNISRPEEAMSIAEVIAAEEDVDWLRLEKPARSDVHVRVADSFDHSRLAQLPAECSLLAVSSMWGLCFVGDEQSLKIFQLEKVAKLALESTSTSRAAPEKSVNLASRPQWIRLAMSDRKVLVGFTDGTVDVWDVKGILSGTTTPDHTYTGLGAPLLNLLPNPSPEGGLPQLVLALSASSLAVLEIGQECRILRKLEQAFTCVAWSPKGKQFVLGKSNGAIEQYTPEGEKKAEIPLPSALAAEGGYSPVSIGWLENDLLLVTYNTQVGSTSEPVNDQKQYLVHRQSKASPPVFSFTLFEDILPAWGLERSGNFRNIAHIRNWGARLRHLTFLSSAPAIDVAILQGNSTTAPTGPPMWDVIRPDESARPGVPMQEDPKEGSASDDTTVLGLAVDLTSQSPIQQEMEGGESQPDLPPAPRLLEYTSDGVLVVYNVINLRDGPYEHMVKPQDILTSSFEMQLVASTTTATSQSPFASAAGSPFTSAPAPAKPSFGFGGGTSIPSVSSGFGGANPFANATKAAIGAPAFGSNSFGVAASSPGINKPAFGTSAFGQPATPGVPAPTKSAFGTAAFGSPVPATPATPAPQTNPTSAFGGSTAFGQSAFGSSTTPKAAFGSSAFGAASPFGASAFGKPAVASPATQSPQSSPAFGFGAVSTSSEKPAAKPASAFGATSAFGSSSPFGALPAFGQTSMKADDDAKSQTSNSDASKPKSSASPFSLGGFGDMLNDDDEDTQEKADLPAIAGSMTKPTSSFIKPAQSGSFFAKVAQSSPSFTPPATVAESPKAPSSPGVQFGQSSGFGVPKPAFGTSAFDSAPAFGASAFGVANPATTTPVKEPPQPKPIQATGGFAGFSTPSKSTGGSAFPSSGGFSAFGAAKATPFGGSPSVKETGGSSALGSTEKVEMPVSTPGAEPQVDEKAEPEPDAESSEDVDAEETEGQSPGQGPEILEDVAQEPEEADQSLGDDHERHEAYTDSEEEEIGSQQDDDSEQDQEEESNTERSATSTSSSPVLVERPDEDSEPTEKGDSPEKVDSDDSPFVKGHARKTSKVHAAAQEWENLAKGSNAAEPVKNSPTKFSFDTPGLAAEAFADKTADEPKIAEPSNPSVPNFFGTQPSAASPNAVPKPSASFSFGSTPAKATEAPSKPTFAGVGVQPPSTSSLNPKPNAFGFRAPTTTPAKSSPLVNATLPLLESQEAKEVKGFEGSNFFSKAPRSSKVPQAESPFTMLPSTTHGEVNEDSKSGPEADIQSAATEEPEVQNGMTKAFSDAFVYLEQELKSLKILADENQAFHASSAGQGQSPSKDDVPLAEFWYLSALDVFCQATKDSYESVVEIRKAGIELNEQVKKAMSNMTKADNLSENCARYKRARTDPEFRKRLRARQLGPQQAENQIMLQASYKSVVNKLNKVEDQMTEMKRKTSQERTGRMPLRPSAVEGISQSLREIETKVQRESDALEDLSHRVKQLSVRKALGEEREKEASISAPTDEESISTITLSTADIASSALNSEHDASLIRESLFKARKQPLVSETSNARSSALSHSAQKPVGRVSRAKRSGAFGIDLDLPTTPLKPSPTLSRNAQGFAAAQLPTNGTSFFNIQPIAMAGIKSSFHASNKSSDKKHGSRGFSAYSPGGSDGH